MDLTCALELRVAEPTRVRVLVPDVTGDGADDELEYAWDGTPGSDLVRSVNGTPQTVAENVSACTFGYLYSDTEKRIVLSEHGVEACTVAEFTGFPAEAGSVFNPRPTFELKTGRLLVETFVPKNDAEQATQIRVRAKRTSSGPDSIVRIVDAGDEAVLAEGRVLNSSLTGTVADCTVPLAWTAPDGRGLRRGSSYYVLMYSDGMASYSSSIEYDCIDRWETGVSAWPNDVFFQYSTNWGSTWQDLGDKADLLFTLYGQKRREHGRIDTAVDTRPKAVDVTVETCEGLYQARQHVQVRLLNL
jgi:hypothetical protein